MIEWIVLMMLGIALGKFVMWLGMMTGILFPKAPLVFRLLFTPPMLVGVVSALAIIYIGLAADNATIFGLDALWLLGIYFTSHFLTFLLLNVYGVWWSRKWRKDSHDV